MTKREHEHESVSIWIWEEDDKKSRERFRSSHPEVFCKNVVFRSSHPEVFCKNVVFRNSAKSTGKHLCWSLFFNKVAGLNPNYVKFLRTPFYTEHIRTNGSEGFNWFTESTLDWFSFRSSCWLEYWRIVLLKNF